MAIYQLKQEIDNDPLGRGYAGMTDQQVAASLNASDRNVNKSLMEATEVLNAVDVTEWGALLPTQQDLFLKLLAIGRLNPFGVEATLVRNIFGAGSATVAALAVARVETMTRARELGLEEPVRPGHVAEARSS